MNVADLSSLEQSVADHARRVVVDMAGHALRRRPGEMLTEHNLAQGWLRWIALNSAELSGLDEDGVSRLLLAYRTEFFAADRKAEESTRRRRHD